MRKAILAALVLTLAATAAPAQGWAEKMFSGKLTHDFGNVPRGAQLVHRFSLTNIYAVRMQITGIKSGCGCVSASAAKMVLEPRESTTVEVRMDARRFTGPKTVGVRVTVGPEYVSSAELKVSGNSRADVVFNPGQVTFGSVARGQTPTQTIDVEYAGTLAWQIKEVLVRDLPYSATFKEIYRRPGEVGYRLSVTLKADAPAGALKHELFLKTNDPASPLVPVLVEANVQESLTFSPPRLGLGTAQVGTPVLRKVILGGARPFRIASIEGTGAGVKLEGTLPAVAARRQVLTFRCEPPGPGPFRYELRVKTTLQDAPATLVIEGNATAAPVRADPPNLGLGEVQVGKPLVRRVVLRGTKPFRVVAVEGAGAGIELEPLPADAAERQMLTLKCSFGEAGAIKRQIKIKTNVQEAPVTVTVEGNAAR
jgi:hypothetical protein